MRKGRSKKRKECKQRKLGPKDPDETEVQSVLPEGMGDRAYLWGMLIGIATGTLLCLAGFVLAILGLAGSIEWVLEAEGLKSRLSNASPGVLFALLGVVVLWRYRPRLRKSWGPDGGLVEYEQANEWRDPSEADLEVTGVSVADGQSEDPDAVTPPG